MPTTNVSKDNTEPSTSVMAHITNGWEEKFHIPWTSLPSAILNTLNSGKHLPPAMRHVVIRTICDAIYNIAKHPGRKALNKIAQKITLKYPQLLDKICGDVIGTGYDSIAMQLINRMENLNRSTSLKNRWTPTDTKSKRRKRIYAGQDGTSSEDEPDNAAFVMLKELFDKGPKFYNEDQVIKLLNSTYSQQRSLIDNEAIDIVIKECPFLFTKVGLLIHFNKLVGFNLEEKLQEFYQAKAKVILSYFKGIKNEDVKKITEKAVDNEQHTIAVIIKLIMIHFKENEDGLFIIKPVSIL